jgi:hypothetical protein
MPFGGLASLGLAAGTGAFQIFKGLRQAKEARKLRLQDNTPAAFKEELEASRLAANNQRLPGEGQIVDRINAGFTNGVNNAIQAGTGSAGILSAVGRLDQNRNNSILGLGQQAAQYQLGQQNRLSGNLRQQAAYQQQDRDAFNREKAALKEASSRNIFGGISTVAGAGITGLTGGFKAQKAYNNQVASGAINPNITSADNTLINNQSGIDSFYNNGYRNQNWKMFELPGSKSYNPFQN